MAGKFQGTDFYDVDSLLSEEERMIGTRSVSGSRST